MTYGDAVHIVKKKHPMGMILSQQGKKTIEK